MIFWDDKIFMFGLGGSKLNMILFVFIIIGLTAATSTSLNVGDLVAVCTPWIFLLVEQYLSVRYKVNV